MEDTLAKLSRKSDTAAAIRYASSRWQALTRYVDDGQLEIDNNAAERALRVVALGRKNSHDRQHCQAWHSELRHKCSFVTGKAREHTRRLLELSFARWITKGNDSSEGCLYLPAEIRMHDSKFLLKGSLTDRALVLCLVTSWWTLRCRERGGFVACLCSCDGPYKTKQFSCDSCHCDLTFLASSD
jgi:hypothetical protein